ncbi:MAG: fibronectin type III domain-containing protein [Patescibacteria group bacterium]
MKKLLMIILLASIITPSLAFADNKSERKWENDSHKYAQTVHKYEKKEKKEEHKEERKEWKEERKKEKREHKEEKKENKAKKINYFFCVTATGWNVVPVDAYKHNNSSNYLGEDCVKLPGNIAKRLRNILGTGTTTPDIIAPVISGISASFVAPTSAKISWTTNEPANGNVYFSTSTPVNLSTATTVGTSTLSTVRSLNITGLTASTTYYYVVKSADIAGNVSTSTQQSFVTPAVADTIAPTISSIVISPVASTTATVSWNTNEFATGKLWYGTSTPTTLFASTTTGFTHVFNLFGLVASTTYNLLFEAKDAASNTATSSASFVTTN